MTDCKKPAPFLDVYSVIKSATAIANGVATIAASKVTANDVTIIACGLMVQEALKAVEILKNDGVSARMIDMHTIKPIDRELIVKAAEETGAIVTAEEHNIIGGLGAAVSEVIGATIPVPIERVGVEDTFGHSGHPDELLKKFGLTPEHIAEAAQKTIKRKK